LQVSSLSSVRSYRIYIAVPVHNNTSLPSGVGEELGGALGKPQAGIRDDQADTGEVQMLSAAQ
jgi:hypothetical protein